LETYCPDIVTCRVMVGKPHRHHENGNRFDVHIDIAVPGEEIAVSHSPNFRKQVEEGTKKDVRTVVRDAFAAAKRQLQDYVRRRRSSRWRSASDWSSNAATRSIAMDGHVPSSKAARSSSSTMGWRRGRRWRQLSSRCGGSSPRALSWRCRSARPTRASVSVAW